MSFKLLKEMQQTKYCDFGAWIFKWILELPSPILITPAVLVVLFNAGFVYIDADYVYK